MTLLVISEQTLRKWKVKPVTFTYLETSSAEGEKRKNKASYDNRIAAWDDLDLDCS